MAEARVLQGLKNYYGNARTIQLIAKYTGEKSSDTEYYDGVIKHIELNKDSYPHVYEILKRYEEIYVVAKDMAVEQKVCLRTAVNRLYKEAKKLIEVIETYEELEGRV